LFENRRECGSIERGEKKKSSRQMGGTEELKKRPWEGRKREKNSFRKTNEPSKGKEMARGKREKARKRVNTDAKKPHIQ